MGGKEGQETGRKGWKGRNEWKRGLGEKEKKGDARRKEAKQEKETRREKMPQRSTTPQLADRFPQKGRGLSDVIAQHRPRRPRPSVVKSPGTLVAAGSAGPRSLGGCESLGLWPPAQAAPAAGQGGNCPETRRLSGRVVQGRASRTRGGGSHARAPGPRAVRLRPHGDLPPPGERDKRRGRPPMPR